MCKKILYFECNSGISGDMTVAALLDLGADRQVLEAALSSLPLIGYKTEIKEVYKSGIRACDFNVILEQDSHDHDMQYLYGEIRDTAAETESMTESESANKHAFPENRGGTEHGSLPAEMHSGHSHAHHHDARNLNDIIEIIHSGEMTDNARTLAIRIFTILARAEAKVHGSSVDKVHFHEVGAVDSIVDIVAVAVCMDNLAPDQIVFSPLTDGTGQIRCQHGIIPVPVPAVTAIAENERLIMRSSQVQGELVTPTGAAITAALSSGANLPQRYRILKTGYGAGKRDYAASGILRAQLLESTKMKSPDVLLSAATEEKAHDIIQSEPAAKHLHDTILNLETNIDDSTGEALSHTMGLLLEAGALDVFYTPIYMKKNRPAYLLTVLCRLEDRSQMETIIFRNTTTIGIRVRKMERTLLEREIVQIKTPWGEARVKRCKCGRDTYCYPENDSVSELAAKNHIGFSEMYHRIRSCAQNQATKDFDA